MEPPKPDYSAYLLEQAYLAYTHKQYAEARMMLETLVTTNPNDRETADLYARVVAAQASSAGQGSSLWNRNFLSKPAGQALIFGLAMFVFGIINAMPAIQAGFAQGFGPHTTIVVGSKYISVVPIHEVLFHASLFILIGLGMFAYCWWDFRKNKVGRNG